MTHLAGGGKDPRGSYLCHEFRDNVETALLLHDHPQHLNKIAVSELPEMRWAEQGKNASAAGSGPRLS